MREAQPKKRTIGRKIWHHAKRIFLWMLLLQFVYIILLRWIDPPITMTQLVSWVKGNGLSRDYINYSEMGDNAKLAVIAGDDQLFPDHDGFDIKSIKKAMKYNKTHPNKTRGASTISQQTAKNVFLWQGGGWFRKGMEVYFTFMIETFWSKERILEVYLNVAETGKGCFGIQAASQRYFSKDAGALSRFEAAQIAGCLPNPVRYTVKPLSKFVSFRAGKIMRGMSNLEGDPDIKDVLH